MSPRLQASLLALVASASLTWAGDGIFGTKASSQPMATGEGPIGAFPVLQMIVALGLVIGLVKYVLPKALTRFNKRLVTPLTGGIHIEESASFAGGNLYVVSARGKSLLLSVSSTGVSCLADLTDAPTFDEMVQQAPDQSGPEEVVAVADPVANEQLARLTRLLN